MKRLKKDMISFENDTNGLGIKE